MKECLFTVSSDYLQLTTKDKCLNVVFINRKGENRNSLISR